MIENENIEETEKQRIIDELDEKRRTLENEADILRESERKLLKLKEEYYENNEQNMRCWERELNSFGERDKKMQEFLEQQITYMKKLQYDQEIIYEELSNEIHKAQNVNEEECEQTTRAIHEIS